MEVGGIIIFVPHGKIVPVILAGDVRTASELARLRLDTSHDISDGSYKKLESKIRQSSQHVDTRLEDRFLY